ncbi:hypothetical protein EAX62_13145 [Tessaracoccus antarcticus]|uniref:Uncharacterized protein n=2 Tax=Tessaracoccus antarcticus TaxID=2479848 RepID=A0A3M0G0L4_9ACTN|nr:hypothetical protein EAX62_13145 [Tessaracoccus antarcticus]
MNDDDPTPVLHPDLDAARYGAKHDGDRFVGFWLSLVMEGRQYRLRPNARQTRRIMDRFYAGKDVVKAFDTVGQDAVNEQLRLAASVYFTSCLTDPQYANTLWRMNRIEPEKLRDKMARDTVNTLAMLGGSGGLVGRAVRLPALLTDGLLDSLAPKGAEELARALEGNPAAMRAMEITEGA